MLKDKPENDKDNFDKKQKKLQLIILTVVVPAIVVSGILYFYLESEFNANNSQMNAEEFGFIEKGDETYLFVDNEGNIITTNLFDQQKPFVEEVQTITKLFSGIEMHCYNVDLYTGGKYIIYLDTMQDIDVRLENNNRIDFYNNFIVKKYMEIFCKHIINDLPPPKTFDQNRGIDSFEACSLMNQPKNYCNTLQKLSEQLNA